MANGFDDANDEIARRTDMQAYERLAKEFASDMAGKLVIGTVEDRLMAIRKPLKAERFTERKKPALVLEEGLELHFWSTNLHDNISMITAIEKVLIFAFPAKKTIVTRMGSDEYRMEFGLKRIFIMYTKSGWRLKSHSGFYEPSGNGARGRAWGHGPDRSL